MYIIVQRVIREKRLRMTSKRSNSAHAEPVSVAEFIRQRFDQFTRAERKPARLLMSNYPFPALAALPEFSRLAGVSHPTILRFVAKLGFSGYPAFQLVIRNELEERLKSPLAKYGKHDPITSTEKRNILSNFAAAACENIHLSVKGVPSSEFVETLSLLLDNTNTVYLLGGRFTDSIATYLYMHLRVLRSNVYQVTGPPVSWPEYLLNMNHKSVLVVFDIRRYQDEVVCFAEEAAQRGVSVILFTDSWLSPIASTARHVFSGRIEVPSSWDSVVTLIVFVEALISAISDIKWSEVKGRINDLEKLRSRFGNSKEVE